MRAAQSWLEFERYDPKAKIAGLPRGFEELNAGQTRPIAQFAQEMQQKYGISG